VRLLRLFVSCVVAGWPRVAAALPYETFIQVESEEDLYDLRISGQISERSLDALLLLFQTKVDLGRANADRLYALPNLDLADVERIVAYREQHGLRSYEDLEAARIVEPAKLRALRAFVRRAPRSEREQRAAGWVRLQSRWSGRLDRLPPASAVQARLLALGRLDAGAAVVLTRTDVGDVRWDPARNGLSVSPERVRVVAPKLYVAWRESTWELIAGTFRIGFGLRLTFDTTDQVSPHGFFGDYELRRVYDLSLGCKRLAGELLSSPCSAAPAVRITPDFRWTNRLTGVAVGLRISAPKGSVELYFWGSYQVHRLPQYEAVERTRCPDPTREADAECDAPPVFVRQASQSPPASTLVHGVLPAMWTEALAGGRMSYVLRAGVHVGVTAYGAVPRWLVEGVALDFRRTARRPFGGFFGAVGVDAAWQRSGHRFQAEVTRSFDRQPGGGGFGAVARTVHVLRGTEVEASARYYGKGFANPYARPISAPDELDGLRARDEVGARLRTASRFGPRWTLRTLTDVWRRISARALQALLFTRADLALSEDWVLSLWATYRHRLRHSMRAAARIGFRPSAPVALAAQLDHAWVDFESRAPTDVGVLVELVARAVDRIRLRARLRYDVERFLDRQRRTQVWWASIDSSFVIRDRDVLRLRYDLRAFVDERASARAREPHPEHWLWVEATFHF